MNQEYVNWLQEQPLPNSKGAMGITAAETILSNRSDLDHAYQKRFLEEKMQRMEKHFETHGLPRSSEGVVQTFKNTIPSSRGTFNAQSKIITAEATKQGFGEKFQIDHTSRKESVKQHASIDQRISEKKSALDAQKQIRKTKVEDQTQ